MSCTSYVINCIYLSCVVVKTSKWYLLKYFIIPHIYISSNYTPNYLGRVVLLVWHKNDRYEKSRSTFILWNPIVGNFWKFDLTKYHLAMLIYKWKKSLTFFTPCYIKRKIIHYDIRSSQKSSVLMLIHVCTFTTTLTENICRRKWKVLKKIFAFVKKLLQTKSCNTVDDSKQ